MKNHKKHSSNPFEYCKSGINCEVLDVISELSKTAMRIYVYLYKHSFKQDGIVYLDRKEIKFELGFRENKSIYNGLSELLHKEIIASCTEKDEYYYNNKFINN